jgi:hypothetical protein
MAVLKVFCPRRQQSGSRLRRMVRGRAGSGVRRAELHHGSLGAARGAAGQAEHAGWQPGDGRGRAIGVGSAAAAVGRRVGRGGGGRSRAVGGLRRARAVLAGGEPGPAPHDFIRQSPRAPLAAGVWTHVAGAYDPATGARLFINASLAADRPSFGGAARRGTARAAGMARHPTVHDTSAHGAGIARRLTRAAWRGPSHRTRRGRAPATRARRARSWRARGEAALARGGSPGAWR